MTSRANEQRRGLLSFLGYYLRERLPPSPSSLAPSFCSFFPRHPPSAAIRFRAKEKINPLEPRAVSLWVLLPGNIYERSRTNGRGWCTPTHQSPRGICKRRLRPGHGASMQCYISRDSPLRSLLRERIAGIRGRTRFHFPYGALKHERLILPSLPVSRRRNVNFSVARAPLTVWRSLQPASRNNVVKHI